MVEHVSRQGMFSAGHTQNDAGHFDFDWRSRVVIRSRTADPHKVIREESEVNFSLVRKVKSEVIRDSGRVVGHCRIGGRSCMSGTAALAVAAAWSGTAELRLSIFSVSCFQACAGGL